MPPRFELGQIVFTPGARAALAENNVDPLTLIARHVSGDWGIVSEDDAKENELSIKEGFRIWSTYKVGLEKIYVITEADRSSTCLLLPNEY